MRTSKRKKDQLRKNPTDWVSVDNVIDNTNVIKTRKEESEDPPPMYYFMILMKISLLLSLCLFTLPSFITLVK